jgi:hypothetical protein
LRELEGSINWILRINTPHSHAYTWTLHHREPNFDIRAVTHYNNLGYLTNDDNANRRTFLRRRQPHYPHLLPRRPRFHVSRSASWSRHRAIKRYDTSARMESKARLLLRRPPPAPRHDTRSLTFRLCRRLDYLNLLALSLFCPLQALNVLDLPNTRQAPNSLLEGLEFADIRVIRVSFLELDGINTKKIQNKIPFFDEFALDGGLM